MPYSAAQNEANKKYRKNNLKRLIIDFQKADFEKLEEYCKTHNLTKSGFVKSLVSQAIENDIKK